MTETLAARKPLTGYHLKLIALITMFIDHIGMVFFPQVRILRAIGRISFPLYVFLAAEGCRYTHDRFKYAMRLYVFAFLSEIPYDLALYPDTLAENGWGWNFTYRTNVFFTLFIAVSIIQIFDVLLRHSWIARLAAAASELVFLAIHYLPVSNVLINIMNILYLPALLLACGWLEKRPDTTEPGKVSVLGYILCLLAVFYPLILSYGMGCSYGVFGVASVCLVYLGKDVKWRSILLALAFLYYYGLDYVFIALQGGNVNNIPLLLLRLAFALLAAALTAFAYNGQRGKPVKWAFYAAYPVHLGILAALRALLGL